MNIDELKKALFGVSPDAKLLVIAKDKFLEPIRVTFDHGTNQVAIYVKERTL